MLMYVKKTQEPNKRAPNGKAKQQNKVALNQSPKHQVPMSLYYY